jgi:hypothetical protein
LDPAKPSTEALQPSLVTQSELVPQSGLPVAPEPSREDGLRSPDMAPQSSPSICIVPQAEAASAVFAESGPVNPSLAHQSDLVPGFTALVSDLRAEVVALRESDANSREQIEMLRSQFHDLEDIVLEIVELGAFAEGLFHP